MTSMPSDCDRLESRDIFAMTPFVASTPFQVTVGIFYRYFGPTLALGIAGLAMWTPAALIVIVILCLGAWSDRDNGKKVVLQKLERRRLNEQRRGLTTLESRAENPSLVSGIRAGMWVCNKNEYTQAARSHRHKHGRGAESPPAEYRFVVATLARNGQSQQVGFSNGEVVDWFPSSSIYHRPPRSPVRNSPSAEDDINALTVIMDMLSECSTGVDLESLNNSFGGKGEASLLRAIEVGVSWGLIRSDDGESLPEVMHAARTPSLRQQVALQPTETAKLWQLCSPQSRAAREKRKRMSENKAPRFTFQKGSNNNVNYAEGDIVGQTTNFNTKPSDDELLGVLRQLLERTDLPWEGELSEVRPEIQEAVDQNDAKKPGLRDAIQKLLKFGGAIMVGVSGNTAYDVLKGFVS